MKGFADFCWDVFGILPKQNKIYIEMNHFEKQQHFTRKLQRLDRLNMIAKMEM